MIISIPIVLVPMLESMPKSNQLQGIYLDVQFGIHYS